PPERLLARALDRLRAGARDRKRLREGELHRRTRNCSGEDALVGGASDVEGDGARSAADAARSARHAPVLEAELAGAALAPVDELPGLVDPERLAEAARPSGVVDPGDARSPVLAVPSGERDHRASRQQTAEAEVPPEHPEVAPHARRGTRFPPGYRRHSLR